MILNTNNQQMKLLVHQSSCQSVAISAHRFIVAEIRYRLERRGSCSVAFQLVGVGFQLNIVMISKNLSPYKYQQGPMQRPLYSHKSFQNSLNKLPKPSIQTELIEQLNTKIAYLSQQILQYKALVDKFQLQLRYKEQQLQRSYLVVEGQTVGKQMGNPSLLTKSHSSHGNSLENKYPTENYCILKDVVKMLGLHCCQEVVPSLRQKTRRLQKLEKLVDYIAEFRVRVTGHVERPQSLRQTWRWLRDIVQNHYPSRRERGNSVKPR